MEPKTIAERAAKLGFPAVALADRNGLYGAMPFSDACFGKGVQPIIGAMLAVARPPEIGGEAGDRLARAAGAGRAGLCQSLQARLVRASRPPGRAGAACRVRQAAKGLAEGLIALTAGAEGALARLIADGQQPKAEAYLDRLQPLFPERLYIELSRRHDAIEEAAEAALIDLAYARNLPLVATNPAAYADPAFHAAHDAMLCIANSAYVESADRVSSSPDAWLKDGAAMAELFADLPEALANTTRRSPSAARSPRRSASRSCRASATTRTSSSAAMRTPALRRGCETAARKSDSATSERLDYELDIITGMGFAGYFLIVADFIKWAKANDIPVGPGPRFGRRIGRRLVADHHRSRPDCARPAVRALPQSRTRVDARLRHRLLRNPPRQGDHLRPAASTGATRSRRSSPSGG